MPKIFTFKELDVLDDLTANSKVVLASLGGPPRMHETERSEDYGVAHRFSERKHGLHRQRVGSFHR